MSHGEAHSLSRIHENRERVKLELSSKRISRINISKTKHIKLELYSFHNSSTTTFMFLVKSSITN